MWDQNYSVHAPRNTGTCHLVRQCRFWMIMELYSTEGILIDDTRNTEYHHVYPLNQSLSCVKTSSMFPSSICLHHVGEHVRSDSSHTALRQGLRS